MPLSALVLVLLAAVLHASWNMVAKRASGDQRFTLITSLFTTVLWLPAGLWFGWTEVPRWGWLEWDVVSASALVLLLGESPAQRGAACWVNLTADCAAWERPAWPAA